MESFITSTSSQGPTLPAHGSYSWKLVETTCQLAQKKIIIQSNVNLVRFMHFYLFS